MTSANIQHKNTFLNWGISIVVGLVLSAGLSATASYDVSTIAGSSVSFSGDGAIATAARLQDPYGIFVHSSGDVYFSDKNNQRIRKITASTGFISTIAGTGTIGFSGDNGAATAATFQYPAGICLDSSNNIYIADYFNGRIRKITATTGVISTIQTGLNKPTGIFLDSSNTIYFADSNNHRVCKIVSGTMSVIAGITGTAGFSGDGAAATAAMLNTPAGIYVDSSNNVYIADTGNHLIRKISGGIISTIAGTTAGYSGDGASANAAYMSNPGGVCKDSTGKFYFADTANNCIRQITTAGIISTLSGFTSAFTLSGPRGICVDSSNNLYVANTGGSSILKRTSGGAVSILSAFTGLTAPQGIFVDSVNNIFVANTGGNNIKMLWGAATFGSGAGQYAQNSVYTIASSVTPTGIWAVGSATPNNIRVYFTDASGVIFFKPASASNSLGTVYTTAATAGTTSVGIFGVADTTSGSIDTLYYTKGGSANNIYRLPYNYNTQSGSTTSVAGSTSTAGFSGDGATATSSLLNSPYGIYFDGTTVYVSDSGNNRIRQFTVGGNISTFAGPNGGFSSDGTPATTAKLNSPNSVYVNGSTVYVADSGNHRIRTFSTVGGPISTIVGTGSAGFLDGSTTVAVLNSPQGVTADTAGNIYITEIGNDRIRKLTGSTVSTLAGGFGDGGLATAANLNSPWALTTDSSGNIYIADFSNSLIRKIAVGTGIISTIGSQASTNGLAVDSAGNVYSANFGSNTITKFTLSGGTYTSSVFAGSGSAGNANGTGTAASFRGPSRIAFGPSGNLYVADQTNHVIRMITPLGVVSTIAGIAQTSGFLDGNGTIAKFLNPSGIAVDSSENIFVTEQSTNSTIRKIMNSGGVYTVSTVAGANGTTVNGAGYVDGLGTAAKFNNPVGIGIDRAGSIYVADRNNNRIRQITYSAGVYSVSTIAGGTSAGTTDGTGLAALFNGPSGLCVDNFGNILVADNASSRIRKLLSKLTVSGGGTLSATATGTAYIQGGGTAVLPPSNSIDAVEINNGTLQVSTPAPITFNASGGSAVVEILAAINTGAFTFTTPGAVKIATGIAAILDAPSGSSLMSKTGAGRLRAIDNLSASTTPVAVTEGILEVSGASGKLPNAATSVASGGTLQLGTSGGTVAAGAVANASVASGGIMSILAGATGAVTSADISSGGIVSVAAGVTAPSGMFTSATFRSGGILQVADGATLGQSFTSVA
ncbi:MAG: hypothetical protein WCJ92_02870 [Alphaproteobacteria bacterium]